MFKRKYIKVKRDAWETIRQVVVKALPKATELEEYRNTDMSPDEILLASERLASFEELATEPGDLAELVRRDTAKEATVYGGSFLCPTCGCFHAATREYARVMPFCERCGQRIVVPRSETNAECGVRNAECGVRNAEC